MNGYTALATRPFLGVARLCAPDASAAQVTMDSPAAVVMTDLTQVAAVVTQPGAAMEAAHDTMVQRGVRMLLVLDAEGRVAGLLSASDVLGEKPMHLVHERRIRHADLLVADVMTPAVRLDAFEFKAVQAARVGNVVARLMQAGRHHALVTQPDAAGQPLVRGIFSLSQIARQLGLPLQLPEAASSFAEIEAVLAQA